MYAKRLIATLILATSLAPTAAGQVLLVDDDSLTEVLFDSPTRVQDVRPIHLQRGVGIDGTLCEEPLFGWAVAGNPWPEAWNGQNRFGVVRLDTGSYSITAVDMALPARGFSWVIGRTYNPRQEVSSYAHSSDGYQGWNWMQTSQPELVYFDNDANPETDELEDMIYLVYGADRFLEFRRVGTGEGGTTPSETTFRGVNGAAGAIEYVAGSPDLYVYHDQNGTEVAFFGGNTASGRADWQMWKITDAAGNTAYIGSTTATTAVTNGYDASGRILLAFDTEGRRYTYTYDTVGSLTRLVEVKAEEDPGGGWVEVQRVEYEYYPDPGTCTSNYAHGEEGDLRQVKVVTPVSDGSAPDLVETTHYRYWRDEAFDDTSDPDEGCDYNPGGPHLLKMVVGTEGVRRFDYLDATFDDDHLTASDADLKPYSDFFGTYHDGTRRLATAVFDGECGCGGAPNGVYAFTYDVNPAYSDSAGYDVDGGYGQWAIRTVVDGPDGTELYHTAVAWTTQYFDEVGQPLTRVESASDPSVAGGNTYWVTHAYRDGAGRLVEIGSPAHTDSYTHDDNGDPEGSFTLKNTTNNRDGRVSAFARQSGGDYDGFTLSEAHTDVYDAALPKYLLWSRTFFQDATNGLHAKTAGDFEVVRPLIASLFEYPNFVTSGTTGANETQFEYEFHAALVVEKRTITEPAVSTGFAPTGAVSREWYGEDGELLWEQDAEGTITYHGYERGLEVRTVEDADTGVLSNDGVTIPTGLSSSGTLHRDTNFGYDAQGRLVEEELPSGRLVTTHYTALADRRVVVVTVPEHSAGTLYGPAEYEVFNHAGETEAAGVIALAGGDTTTSLDDWIDETEADAIAAVVEGQLASLTAWVYSGSGRKALEQRVFHVIPADMSGASDTNSDVTQYGYDHAGRLERVLDPTGTEVFRAYTARGQLAKVGLRAEIRGGGALPDNQIIWVTEGGHGGGSPGDGTGGPGGGDGGGSGDSDAPPTSAECYNLVQHVQQQYTKVYLNYRDEVMLVETPDGPAFFYKRDNLGRVTAVGVYDDLSDIDNGDWKTTDPIAETTGRRALVEAVYDARGNRHRVTRHKISQTGAGTSSDSLDADTWFDGLGRPIKEKGNQLVKRLYDPLGRVRREYVLAKDNDTAYAHALDVAGDVVLEERAWGYDVMDNVLLALRVDRFHDSTTTLTGPLDENDETGGDGDDLKVTAADLNGRPQITAFWYDHLDRLTDAAAYGTNGGSTLDRNSLSVPGRPTGSSVLLTSHEYDDAGRLVEMVDPLDRSTVWAYDDAGRVTKVVRNYVDGTPGGGTLGDEDQVTEFEYWTGTDDYGTGRLRKIIAKNPGESDQITEYVYGVGSSNGPNGEIVMDITAGHLLKKVVYPDSSDPDEDAVWFGYDRGLLVNQMIDQAGNATVILYDESKRELDRYFPVIQSGFDTRVDRVVREYDGLGRLSTVTQKNDTTVLDQIALEYDGWGELAAFTQDVNSAIDGDAFTVEYEHAKHTAGPNLIHRSKMVYPDLTEVLFDPGNPLNVNHAVSYFAGRCDRVRVKVGGSPVTVAHYDFLGVDRVVGTTHFFGGGDVHSRHYGSTSGSYPGLDAFNRVVTSRWSKERASGAPVDWYLEDIVFDKNSNITRTEHGYFGLLDAAFVMDGLDRLRGIEVGDWTGSGIDSPGRMGEVWDLSHLGNWATHGLDLDGDGDFTGSGEFEDFRTFNTANELTQRALDTDGDTNPDMTLTPGHDAVGNLIDDGDNYLFVYDTRGRLTLVTDRDEPPNTVAEFRYNGLGYLIGEHVDFDASGEVDGDDPWRWFVYDERWRVIAAYRGTDEAVESDAKERYVYHAAGYRSSGSYIDDLVLRDRDAVQPEADPANTDPAETWLFESDGVLEERVFICQNWRADVVLVVDSSGAAVQRAWYTAYGVPTGADRADLNGDGVVDSADASVFSAWHVASDVRADWNLDGTVNSTDTIAYLNAYNSAATLGGRGVLSSAALDLRVGYAGYRWDGFTGRYHVRHRVYEPYLGMWQSRDPIGYDGSTLNLYEYANSNPQAWLDPWGLIGLCVACAQEGTQPEKKKQKPWTGPGDPPNKDDWEDPIRDILDDPLSPNPIDQRRITKKELDDVKKDIKDLATPNYTSPIATALRCIKVWTRDLFRKKKDKEDDSKK
ncbi:MAG TPA: RHS repeat-associated core domain-containing protein [Phycisphaerales bacterium]|nr:RHS repeat-associated core domain-containing protein [Phycisphaerales bacterium]